MNHLLVSLHNGTLSTRCMLAMTTRDVSVKTGEMEKMIAHRIPPKEVTTEVMKMVTMTTVVMTTTMATMVAMTMVVMKTMAMTTVVMTTTVMKMGVAKMVVLWKTFLQHSQAYETNLTIVRMK